MSKTEKITMDAGATEKGLSDVEVSVKSEKEAPPKKRVVIDEKSLKKDKGNEKSEFRQKFETTRFWWRLASAVFLVGFVFQVLSFSTPYWLVFDDVKGDIKYVGLWSTCNGTSISGCVVRNETTGCINTVRGLGGIALLCSIIVCFVLVCSISQVDNRRCLTITAVSFCFVIALTNQISTASFGKSSGCSFLTNGRWAWSGAMAFLSIFLISVSGACFFIHELRQCSGLKKERKARNNIGLIAT